MITRTTFMLPLVVLCLVPVVACSESGLPASPAQPSGLTAPPAPGSATISGTVNAEGVSSAPTGTVISGAEGLPAPAVVSPGITVTVVGTTLSTVTDASGRFVLRGTPLGDIQIHFVGAGINATVTITGVQELERIEITVVASGSTAEIDSHSRHGPDGKVEVEGRITAIDAGARTVQVAGHMIHVSMDAIIRHGALSLQFSDMHVGDRVHIRGTPGVSLVEAQQIKLQNPFGPGNPNEVKLKGSIENLSGSCAAGLQFDVSGTTVTTNSLTTVQHGNCSDLANGVVVEVKGTQQSDGSVLATRIEIEERLGEVELEGVVQHLSGSCATGLEFMVNGTGVMTSPLTRFEDGQCSHVKNGVFVEVKGSQQLSGKVFAARLEIED